MILDNYDSFTYNLVQYVTNITLKEVAVFRNDAINLDEIDIYDKILLSPGPGLPENAGILLDLIERYAASKSILGICLGQQAIAQVYGGGLLNLTKVHHGVATDVFLNRAGILDTLFKEVPCRFKGGRYHSWVIDPSTLPSCFNITAYDEQQQIMGISHQQYDLKGLQFHPESVLTEHGQTIIKNWVNA